MIPAPRAHHVLALPGGGSLELGARTLLMGVVNVTPDSFSDGGQYARADDAVAHALRLVQEGADLLDVGGESTRPGAAEIPPDEQLRRILPVIRGLTAKASGVPLSVDTRSAEVARAAVEAGAAIVNDVSGLLHDPEMAATVASLDAPAVVMHMRGTPADMRERTGYAALVEDVLAELRSALDRARAAGVRHILADPGIGFAKDGGQSRALLAATPRFAELGVPILVGPSRQSFLAGLASEGDPPDPARDRIHGTVATVGALALLGAHVVRVHDVGPCRDAVRVADALRDAAREAPPPR